MLAGLRGCTSSALRVGSSRRADRRATPGAVRFLPRRGRGAGLLDPGRATWPDGPPRCRGILRDDHEAMDAFQATFLVLIAEAPLALGPRFAGSLAAPGRLPGRGRARADAQRRRRSSVAWPRRRSVKPSADDRHDLAAAVHEELDRLPERYRVPIVLCDLEGRTCEEAARHLGCPIGTIGSRLARGRERLRDRLARRGLAPAVGTLVAMLSTDSEGAGMPATLTEIHDPARAGQGGGRNRGRHVFGRLRQVSREHLQESAHGQVHVGRGRVRGGRRCRSDGGLDPPTRRRGPGPPAAARSPPREPRCPSRWTTSAS